MLRVAVRFMRYSVSASNPMACGIAMTYIAMTYIVMTVSMRETIMVIAPWMSANVGRTKHRGPVGICRVSTSITAATPSAAWTVEAALRCKHEEYERQSAKCCVDFAFHKLCASYVVDVETVGQDTEAKE
jgi:hypothetical protein